MAEEAAWVHMADHWGLGGLFVSEVACEEHAESSLVLDISTGETVLHPGPGLTPAGTKGWCGRVGKQRGYLKAF